MAVYDRYTETKSDVSAAYLTNSNGAGYRVGPMVLSARANSSAPVLTRLNSRMRDHFFTSAGLAHAAGAAKKSCRCTLSFMPKRVVQASSMVKQRMGATQVTTRRKISSVTVREDRRRALDAASQ